MKVKKLFLVIFLLAVLLNCNIVFATENIANVNNVGNNVYYSSIENDYEINENTNAFLLYLEIFLKNSVVILRFISIGLIIIPTYIYLHIKLKLKKLILDIENDSNNEALKEKQESLNKKIKMAKYNLYGCLCSAVFLFFISCMLYIVTNTAGKPIIYIYPEEEQTVSVSLKNSDLITCSYPKYDDGWEVLAKPNGDLIDLKTGKELYSLYWEGGDFESPDYKEGFLVKGEDSASFLEEKLEILGLNYKEKEEFIVYWLPKLEKNKYNFIKFVSKEDIDKQMPLEINPTPDTLIRVYMQFKGLTKPMKNVKEQNLEKIERKGFTVVEWGGTEF